jgi:hypothetical protein
LNEKLNKLLKGNKTGDSSNFLTLGLGGSYEEDIKL